MNTTLQSIVETKSGVAASSWICTDPDSLQFRRHIQGNVWEFKEFDRFNYPGQFKRFVNAYKRNPEGFTSTPRYRENSPVWESGEIDLAKHPADEIKDDLITYFDAREVERLMASTDTDDAGLIAECLWEQSCGMY